MSNRLSVVMIAKNAADLLPDCLGSVSWADEIIVLDSGSTDNTVELARRLGAQVYTHTDWRGYGIQRQRAQDYATGPLTGDLLHLTCRDFAGFQQKQLAYAAAWALERHQKGKKTSMAGIFSHTLGAFLKTLLLRGGVLDGKQGWLLAMVNAQYTFTKYTELWALSHGYSEKESS